MKNSDRLAVGVTLVVVALFATAIIAPLYSIVADIEQDKRLTLYSDSGEVRAVYTLESSTFIDGMLQGTTKDGKKVAVTGVYMLEPITESNQ